MSPTIIQAGVLDSSHATDSIILVGWVLDRPIDPAKIEKAWNTLVQAWPILVARLRRKNKLWQYHIPENVSPEGSFSTLRIAGSIHDHYNYSKPGESIRCTVKENPQHLFLPNCPTSVAYLLKHDIPMTYMNVTTFDDASLVGIAVPHILCDGHGVTIIMKALCQIIGGGALPEPLNHVDPYSSFAKSNYVVPSPPYWRALSFASTVILYMRSFWDWIFDGAIENKDVYFPLSEAARIKSEAMEDIRREHGKDTDLYVSTSDVILAFCLKCIYPDTTSSTPLNVFYTVNLRNLLPLPKPFIHNSVSMVITPTVPVRSIREMSLGQLSLIVRKTIVDQGSHAAVENWLRWRLQNANRTKIFFSPWQGLWDVVTNWRDMKLMNIDFTEALPERAADETSKQRVKCVYLWGNGLQPIPLRNWIGLWADDPSGGVWVSAFLPKKTWRKAAGFGQFIRP